MRKDKDRGPQDEPISAELRASLHESEHAVIYGPQNEVILPDDDENELRDGDEQILDEQRANDERRLTDLAISLNARAEKRNE